MIGAKRSSELLLARAEQTIITYRLLPRGSRVLAAVSGGPDSTALLRMLLRLRDRWQWEVGVVHVNHGLRGEESNAEEEFVEDLCRQEGIPCWVFRLRPDHRPPGSSLQNWGRSERYQIMEAIAEAQGYAVVALGHQADDQAETILDHLLRGSGLEGLRGMPYQRGRLIRPLLDVERAAIMDFLAAEGAAYCTDSSNLKPVYLRNRIRQQLLPLLAEYNPAVTATLRRTADILAAEDDWLDQLTNAQAGQIAVRLTSERTRLPVAELLNQPLALQRRLVRRELELLRGDLQGIGWQHVESVLDLCRSTVSGRSVTLPRGLYGRREYQWLLLEKNQDQDRREKREQTAWSHELAVPGETWLPAAQAWIAARWLEPEEWAAKRPVNQVILDGAKLAWPIIARNRRPGDRIQPLGMSGSKKVKDLFIDNKIAREQRNRIPLVVSADGICWVAGMRADRRFAAGADSRRRLQLSYRALNCED